MGKPKMLKNAKYLIQNGFHVFPVHGISEGKCTCGNSACKSPGKHPATPNGFKDGSKDNKKIAEWFTGHSVRNIGIVAGEEFDLLILDVDERSGGFETIKKAADELGPLPDTLTATTGNGEHLYFRFPKGKAIKKDAAGKAIGPGVDVQSNAFVVAPGSTHVNGKAYAWKNGGPDVKTLASLPKKWIRQLSRTIETAPASTGDSPAILEGSRNTALASYTGRLVLADLPRDTVLFLAQKYNTESCAPPLEEAEVADIVESIMRYGNGAGDAGEYLLTSMFQRYFHGGSHIALGSDGNIYTYTGKKWSITNPEEIKGKILETIDTLPGAKSRQKSPLMKQAMDLLKPTLTLRPQIDLKQPLPHVINCDNGELWISPNGNVELRGHSPSSFLRHCLDVKYDPAARSPLFDKAILEIFSKTDKPKKMVRHWHDLTGYLIQPTRDIPLILILYGGGGNGKTALVNIITSLMGEELVTWDRISSASKNQFFFGNLVEKLLLVDDDVSIGTKLPDGELKKISEAKLLTGEKKHANAFSFVCLAVPVLLCNSPMSLSDVGSGMQRRLMVIPFERHFEESEIDRTLFACIKKTEMSGILNHAIAGFQRVMRRGLSFNRPKAVTVAGKRWFDEANPIATFIAERCERGANYSVKLSVLYAAYEEWAKEGGFSSTQQKTHFSRNVQNIIGAGSKKTNSGTAIIGLRPKASKTF